MAVLTEALVKARLSAWRATAIYDDDNDGAVDAIPIAQLISDAESKVAGAIIGPGSIYATGVPGMGMSGTAPPELVRLCLDAATAYAAQRHPEVFRADWVPLMQQLDKELDKLRDGKRGLGVTTTPEPAANHGGIVESDAVDRRTGSQLSGLQICRTFLDGTGDF